ncbi:phosphatidylserine/phosphatidylglycerophosphate/cardiolipin synthase-like enzyme [Streptomyces sp. TLI_146]|nr:phosphatidylserine/phosphatidylglycerophosphate/cardiolipin synthase-like enzyme [Streptomyces sp. TLI_146]
MGIRLVTVCAMKKTRSLLALALGASGLFAAAPAPAAAAPVPLVTTGAVFNDPTGDTAAQDAVFGHIARLVDGAQKGSDIKMSMYVLGSDYLAARLTAAHQRGVNVQVVLDNESLLHWAGKVTYPKLVEGLKPATGSGTSWVRVCAANQACLAKDPNPGDSFHGVNHNKFVLFSRTTGSGTGTVPVDDVVVQTSANQTPWDRQHAFNDALTVVGNTALYTAYTGYFNDLAAAQAGTKAQVADYPTEYPAGNAKAYFFPRAASDPILNILNTVDNPVNGQPACYGNSPGHGTEDGRTVIRVAMHQITRPEVAQKLWELDDAGCYVDIVYRYLDVEGGGTAIADQLSKPTRFGGIALHRLDDADDGDGDPKTSNAMATHSKFLLIDGTYLGKADQKIVFTGSHPYTKSALTTNDEALLKYDDAAVHDAYRENFRAQRALADQQMARVASTG